MFESLKNSISKILKLNLKNKKMFEEIETSQNVVDLKFQYEYKEENKEIIIDLKNMTPYELGESNKKEAIGYLKKYLENGTPNEKRLAASAVRKLLPLYKEECYLLKDILIKNINSDKPQIINYTLKTLIKYENITENDFAFLKERYLLEEKNYNLELFEELFRKNNISIELKERNTEVVINREEVVKITVENKIVNEELKKNKFEINTMMDKYKNALEVFNIDKLDIEDIFKGKKYIKDEETIKFKTVKNFYDEIIEELLRRVAKNRREYDIFILRYQGYKLQEIGDKYEITREGVRQLINKTINKIINRYKKSNEINSMVFREFTKRIIGDEEEVKVYRMAILIAEAYEDKSGVYNTIMRVIFDDKEFINLRNAVRKFYDLKIEKTKLDLEEQKINLRFEERILNKVVWPKRFIILNKNDLYKVTPKRNINSDGDGISGKFYSHKNNYEIEYESNLEYNVLTILEKSNLVEYYQVQPLIINYGEKNERKYYPDIICKLTDGRGFLIEVKPTFNMFEYRNLVKYDALKNYCIKNGLGYVMLDMNKSIEEVLEKVNRLNSNIEFENEILKKLEVEKKIKWNQYYDISYKYNIDNLDMYKLIINNRLYYSSSPFIISYANNDI